MARYKKQIAPEEAELLRAREDLGDHRMQALPLSGKIVPEWQRITKEQSLEGASEVVLAWHGAFLDQEDPGQISREGIGHGDSHRFGENYRPDRLWKDRACVDKGRDRGQEHLPGRLRSKVDMVPASRCAVQVSRGPGPINQQRISNQTSANHLARQTMASHELVDPRMNDRNWIAAYPDPGDRSLALINTPNEGISRTDVLVSGLQMDVSKVASVKKRTRKTTPALTGGTVESTGLQSALAGAKTGSKKQSSEKADPNVQIRRKRSSRHATGTIAPLSDLVSYPFWIGGPNSPCQPAKNTSKPDPDTALRWTSSTEPTRPNTCELSSSSPDITAQSSKSYIQQRPPELPSHYSKVILRSLAPTRGHVGTFSDETSESSSFGSDVYSDPGLRSFGFQSHANEHGSSDEECLTISGSLHTCNLTHSADSTGRPYLNHREGSSDGQTSFEGLSIPRARQIHDISSGAQSCKIVAPAIDNIEEAKLWLDDQRGLSVQRTIEHVALIYSDDSEIDENEVTKSTKVGNTVASKSSSARSCTGTEFVSTCLDKSARDQDHLDVITQPASVCSSTAEDKGRFLFTIDLDNRRRDVHEREKPSDVVAALCRDHAVEDSDTRERFEHAITAKFQKAFKKLQREQPCP